MKQLITLFTNGETIKEAEIIISEIMGYSLKEIEITKEKHIIEGDILAAYRK